MQVHNANNNLKSQSSIRYLANTDKLSFEIFPLISWKNTYFSRP